ncbi:MAG: hypothetical protein WD276_01475, partial [Actinomycetota bacterium]
MKRTLIWIVVLLIGVGVGFGLGALTYEPPAPEIGSSPRVAPSLSPTALSPTALSPTALSP